MTTSRPGAVARTKPGEKEVFSIGSSTSLHSTQHNFEKFYVGGAIKSTHPIVFQSPQNLQPAMSSKQTRPLNRSLTGPTLESTVGRCSVATTANRRFDVIRNISRTIATQRSTSAHPIMSSTTRSKAAPIRVLSLAHSIPETVDDENAENAAKKRSRSASSIETCRPESPKQLLAFMFSGALSFASNDDWTCSNTVHRILNLTGAPISRNANCKCSESAKGKRKKKQEFSIQINDRIPARKIAAYFALANKFIAESRSAASNILVCHRPDQMGYCIAFVIQYIIVYHDIPLNRAVSHCKALQDVHIPPNAMEALRIWETEKVKEARDPKMPSPCSEDFKWVQVSRPIKLAWC